MQPYQPSDWSFTLEDRDGEIHEYVVTPHSFSATIPVINSLVSMAIGPLAEVFQKQVVSAGKNSGEISIAGILEEIDVEATVQAIQRGMQESGGFMDLVAITLRNTSRDGLTLKDEHALGKAYNANWGEMTKAFFKVFGMNRFFDALTSSISG